MITESDIRRMESKIDTLLDILRAKAPVIDNQESALEFANLSRADEIVERAKIAAQRLALRGQASSARRVLAAAERKAQRIREAS